MHPLDFFRRRRRERQQELADIASAVEGAKLAAQMATSAAELAENAARSSERAAQSAEAAAARLSSGYPMAQSGRRLLGLLGVCIISLLAAVIIGGFIPAAFSEPSANVISSGSVAVVLKKHDSELKLPLKQSDSIVIHASYSANGSFAEYNIWFPERFAGWDFAILLGDSAVLKDPKMMGLGVSIEKHDSDCITEIDGGRSGHSFSKCQVIYGVVPLTGEPTSYPECLEEWEGNNYIPVVVSGRPTVMQSVNWAHRLTTLPALENKTLSFTTPIEDFANQHLNGRYGAIAQTGCTDTSLDSDWKITDAISPPETANGNVLRWNGPEGVSLMTSRRNRGATGNILLALAGATAAVAIGFMAVAYEEWGKWRHP
jgi:hypothetical protein